MLKQEENELICRVGPGTPMGNLMREYWVPALLASELPAPDCNPVRVLLLGEKLIAFRDSNGQVGLLDNNGLEADDQPPGSFSEYQLRDKTAHFEVIDTEGGAAYGARRAATDGQVYWRIAQFCFPFYTFTPPGVLGVKRTNNCRVPMDDGHTLNFAMAINRGQPGTGPQGVVFPGFKPNTTDWYGRFRPEQDSSNDYRIDRDVQRRNEGPDGFTGIHGIAMQDAAMTSSMGPIYDRTKEHLGSADAMVIRVRRRLIAAVKAHMRGVPPPGIDDPEVYRV